MYYISKNVLAIATGVLISLAYSMVEITALGVVAIIIGILTIGVFTIHLFDDIRRYKEAKMMRDEFISLGKLFSEGVEKGYPIDQNQMVVAQRALIGFKKGVDMDIKDKGPLSVYWGLGIEKIPNIYLKKDVPVFEEFN